MNNIRWQGTSIIRYGKSLLRTNTSPGFTLIELLTVLAIVGVLAVGLVTVMNPVEQIAKSRDAKLKSDLAAIQKALEVYYSDNGSYPPSDTGKILDNLNQPIDWGSSGFQPYIQQLPKADANNSYAYQSTGQSYWLYGSLKRGGKDPAACRMSETSTEDKECPNAAGLICGGKCNYGVTSPNTSP